MQTYYGIGYGVISLIFLGQAAGFIFGALCSEPLHRAAGRAITIVVGTSILAVATLLLALALPFGVVVVSFFLIGCAMSFILAQVNVFGASLENSAIILGYVYGSYGIGGIVAPLIATRMISSGIKWSYFYFILFALCIVNSVAAGYIFWNSEKETPVANTEKKPDSRRSILKMSITDKPSIMTAIFLFAYQGAEVSTSGWVTTFLITVRHGVYSRVGYVSAGFWGGLTVGRFVLSHVYSRFGEQCSVFVLLSCSVALQLLVWQVPNIIADAIFESLFGFFSGGLYPATMTYVKWFTVHFHINLSGSVATQLIPQKLYVSSLSLISAVGASGGAIAPFTTGVLAGKYGAWVLYPVTIALLGFMEVVWFVQTRFSPRAGQHGA